MELCSPTNVVGESWGTQVAVLEIVPRPSSLLASNHLELGFWSTKLDPNGPRHAMSEIERSNCLKLQDNFGPRHIISAEFISLNHRPALSIS